MAAESRKHCTCLPAQAATFGIGSLSFAPLALFAAQQSSEDVSSCFADGTFPDSSSSEMVWYENKRELRPLMQWL